MSNSKITHAFSVPEQEKIIFCLQNNDMLTMNLNNFSEVAILKNNNPLDLEKSYMENYVVRSLRLKLSDTHIRYLLVTQNGSTLVSDFLGEKVSPFLLF